MTANQSAPCPFLCAQCHENFFSLANETVVLYLEVKRSTDLDRVRMRRLDIVTALQSALRPVKWKHAFVREIEAQYIAILHRYFVSDFDFLCACFGHGVVILTDEFEIVGSRMSPYLK